jgi:hypothetical protein
MVKKIAACIACMFLKILILFLLLVKNVNKMAFFENLPLDMQVFPRIYGFLGFEGLMCLLSTSKAVGKMFLSHAESYNRTSSSLKFTINNKLLKAGLWLRFFRNTTLTIKEIGNVQHLVTNWYNHIQFADDFAPDYSADKINIQDHIKMLGTNESISIKMDLDHVDSSGTLGLAGFSKVTFKKGSFKSDLFRAFRDAVYSLTFEDCAIKFDGVEIKPKIYDEIKIRSTSISGAIHIFKSLIAKNLEIECGVLSAWLLELILNPEIETLELVSCKISVDDDDNLDVIFTKVFSQAKKLTKLTVANESSDVILPYLHLIPNLTELFICVSNDSDLVHICKCKKLKKLWLHSDAQVVLNLPDNFPAISGLLLYNLDLCSKQNFELDHLRLITNKKPAHNFQNIMDSVLRVMVMQIEKIVHEDEDYEIPYHPLLSSCSIIHLDDEIDIAAGDNSLEYRKRTIQLRIWSNDKVTYPKRNPTWLENLR